MNAAFSHLDELDRQVQTMSRTESPAEVFKVLREACRLAAPRAGLFLVRKGLIQGWSAVGYGPETTRAQRAFSCRAGQGWLGQLLSVSGDPLRARPAGILEPDFGQPSATEAVGGGVVIQGKPIALIVLERTADATPWHPEIIGLLLTVARLRLELDLALRKLKAMPAPQTAVAPEETRPEEVTELAPASADQAEEQSPGLDAARRYARLVATDIRLYNEEAVVLGRRNGDLLRRLEEHLDRGKETFLRRHGDLGPAALELLHDAYVEVLAGGDGKLIPIRTVE